MLQLHVYMTQNKNKEKQYTPKETKKKKEEKSLAVTAGCVRFFEKRLKAALGRGEGDGAEELSWRICL